METNKIKLENSGKNTSCAEKKEQTRLKWGAGREQRNNEVHQKGTTSHILWHSDWLHNILLPAEVVFL